MFFSIFFLDYIAIDLGIGSQRLALIPEILSAIIIILFIPRIRNFALAPKYFILFLMVTLHVMVGVVINSVPEGAVFAGVRNYVKFLPWFFLPGLYRFSDSELRSQVKVLLFLSLIQCPLALFQRFYQFRDVTTGDVITGSLNGSGVLSVYLISATAFILVFYIRKEIKFRMLIILSTLLFIPITLNETKVALFLLPFAVFLPLVTICRRMLSLRMIFVVFGLGTVFLMSFVIIYNALIESYWGHGLFEHFNSGEKVMNYMRKDADGRSFEKFTRSSGGLVFTDRRLNRNEKPDLGRCDSIVNAFRYLSQDITKLFVGLGMGNVSASFLSGFSGEYSRFYYTLGSGMTGLSFIMWELGLVGVGFVTTFFVFILFDAHRLSNRDDITGTFAGGIACVIFILFICLIYLNWFLINSLFFLFMYLSGLVCFEDRLGKGFVRENVACFS